MQAQGFPAHLELAKLFAKAKASTDVPLSQVEKDRRKQLNRVRLDQRLAENLAQRALVQSKRT